MRANTVVMIALAVVFGVVAVFLANTWLSGQRSLLARGDKAPGHTIVVAATPLRFGDTLKPDNLKEIPWSAAALPAGAFQTKKQLLDGVEKGDRQVITAIEANEPVLGWKITGPGQRATLSATLDKGMKAVAIRVNDVLGVAGFVLPGDRVDILLTRHTQDEQGGQRSFVDVLLQSVKVLAIDQVADDRKDKPIVARAVTLEVNTQDAQKLTLAAGVGQLSLALRQAASNKDEVTQRVTVSDLSGDQPKPTQENPQLSRVSEAVQNVDKKLSNRIDSIEKKLTADDAPAAPKEVIKFVTPPKPSVVPVGVTRDLKRQVYEVPSADNIPSVVTVAKDATLN
jgi:pilus assembly protein CpaB